MDEMNIPIVECQMMINESSDKVFQAFIDPQITTKFWFTKSTGTLEKGKNITWEWEMYNVKAEVQVIDIIPNELIKIEWGETPTTVDFEFESLSENSTYVVIKNYGFTETGNDLIEAIKNNTGGFTTVLDGLKAYLEHGIQLHLVRDKFPHIVQK